MIALITGVVTGVISAVFIQLIIILFKKNLLPWYQARIYRGINISGTWKGEQDRKDRGVFRFTLTLKQRGHKLNGTFLSIDEYPDKKDDHEFLVKGEIIDGWVLLTYESFTKNSVGLGSLLLQVKDSGNELDGSIMFLKSKTATIGADEELKLIRSLQ